jgi:hypothetical protein
MNRQNRRHKPRRNRAPKVNHQMSSRPLADKPSDLQPSDKCQFYLAATSRTRQDAAQRDPLDKLDNAFRASAGWSRVGDVSSGSDFVIGMQRPWPATVPGSDHRFVAVDTTFYRGSATRDVAEFQRFWESQINIRPFSMEFVKSSAIWSSLGIKVSPEQTAFMMQMNSVDIATSEAVQAALWSAYNTARYPIDMETAAFVLAAFIHADPLRRQLVSGDGFVMPYDANTAYALLKVYKEKK